MPIALAIPLLILLTAFVAYAMAALQHSASAGFFGWLASKVAAVPIFGGATAEQILKLDRWMTHYIGSHYRAVVSKAVQWVAGLRQYVLYLASATLNLAPLLWSLTWWLVHTEIPRIARAHVKHAERVATHADAEAEAAMKAAAGIRKSHPGVVLPKQITAIQRVAMPRAAEWDWIGSHWKGLQRAIAHVGAIPLTQPIALPRTWVGWTIKQWRIHQKRLLRLEALLGVTGMAVAMARVFGIPDWRCLTRGNIGRTARALCGMSTHLLEDLLGLIADVLILENVCTLIPLLEAGASEVAVPIVDALTVVGAGLCAGVSKPGALQGPAVTVPPIFFDGVAALAV